MMLTPVAFATSRMLERVLLIPVFLDGESSGPDAESGIFVPVIITGG
ncbi:MAG: hypothetical protein ACKVON_02740 [Beijerinckiaceae bacterium]